MKKPRCKCKRYYLSWEDPVFHEPGRYYFFKVNHIFHGKRLCVFENLFYRFLKKNPYKYSFMFNAFSEKRERNKL